MKQRLTALLLALALCLSLVPAQAAGAEPNIVYITLQTGHADGHGGTELKQTMVYALEEGNDLLLSAADLGRICNFSVQFPDSNTLTFTRGYKVVSVDLNTSAVRMYSAREPNTVKSQDAATLPSQVQQLNGQYYLSAAGMLPRLNVSCTLDDGLLTIVPNPVSLWDYLYDVDLNDYIFDIAYCAQVLGCTQKHIESLVYSQKDLSKSVICTVDYQFADTKDFYAIFDRFVKDETATDEAVAQLEEAYGVAAKLAENYDEVFEWMDLVCPDSSHIFDAKVAKTMGIVFQVAETTARLITYYNLFNQDNSKKIDVLESIVANRSGTYNQALMDAARQVELAYEDYWLGLLFHGGYKLSQDAADFITFESLRESFRVNYLGQLPDNELLEKTVYLEGLMDVCQQVYDKKFDPNSRQQLSDWYAHAFLYFYSVEQIYRGMAQHVVDMKGGQLEDLQSFGRTAETMEAMYGRYLVSSLYLNNDLFDQSYFSAKSQEFLASFPHVKRMATPGAAAPAAEYAIFLKPLWDMVDTAYGMPEWTVADIDGDGGEELLLTYTESCYHTVVLDNWAIDHDMMHYGAYDNLRYLQTASGLVFQRHDYDDGEMAYTSFYTWDGQEWTETARWQNFDENETENWADFFYDECWFVDGIEVAESTYNEKVAPFLSAGDVAYNYASADERTIQGDALELMEDLTAHFADREGFVKSLQIDVNNDMYMDRVYLLTDAVNMWLDLQDSCLDIYAPSSMHEFRDRAVTLVLAENYGSEVRLRVQRMGLPYMDAPDMLADAKAKGTALQLWEEVYYYQPYDDPFSTNPMYGGSPADVLIGLTPAQVKGKLTDYEEWIGSGEGIAQGYLDGQLVQVWYASHYGMAEGGDTVLSANVMEQYPSPYSICFDLELTMDVFTILRTVYPGDTISTRWSTVNKVTTETGEQLCRTECYYMHYESGNMYKLTLLYPDGDGHVAPTAFNAELLDLEEVPQKVWDELDAQ